MQIEGIDHVALTVSNIARSIVWYQWVLGLERRHAQAWGDRPAVLCAGTSCLALFAADTEQPHPTPDHNTIGLRHVAFRVDRMNFAQARRELSERGIDFTFEDHTISHSIYILDPDGHRIEITTYDLKKS